MASKRKANDSPEFTDHAAKLMRFRGSSSSSSESSPEPQLPDPPSSPTAPPAASPTDSSTSGTSVSGSSPSASASPSSESDAAEAIPSSSDPEDSDVESSSSDETSSSSASANYDVTLDIKDVSEGGGTRETTLLGTYPSATSANHAARQVLERWSAAPNVEIVEESRDGLLQIRLNFNSYKRATVVVERVEK